MALTPFDFLEAMARDPARFLRTSRTVTLALGNATWDLAEASKRVAREQLGSKWPGLVDFAFRGHAGHAEALRWSSGQASAVFAAITRNQVIADLTLALPNNTNAIADRVLQVLDDLAGGARANLSIDHMREFIGRKWLTRDDIVIAIGRGVEMVSTEVNSMAGGAWNATRLEDALYRIHGISGFFGTVVQRSGYEWGGRMEVRSLAALIIEGTPTTKLRMGLKLLKIDADELALGPDIVRYISRRGRQFFEIFQCKALADFGTMAAERATSESVRQLFSDMGRLGKQGWRGAARTADDANPTVPFDGTYTFLFDFDHFIRKCEDPVAYIERFVARHEDGFTFDVVDPSDLQGEVAFEMALAMKHMADQLAETVNALRTVGRLSDVHRSMMLDGVNAILAGRSSSATAVTIADMTPTRVVSVNLLTADEAAAVVSGSADDLLRAVIAKTIGLTPEALADMPRIKVNMKLVMRGEPGFIMEPPA